MRALALISLALLFACSDDDEPNGQQPDSGVDASLADASRGDAASLDASRVDASRLDASIVDTTCYSALRPPAADAGRPTATGCACDKTVEREPYCLGRPIGAAPYLLKCDDVWRTGADGNCAPFSGGSESCEQRGYSPRPTEGCGRGYAPVAGGSTADGGVVPGCCVLITVSDEECTAGGFDPQALEVTGNGFFCRDGRLPLAQIPDFEPAGCCER